MKTFKDYFRHRTSDQAFKQEYYQNCSICPITIEILQKLEKSTQSIEALALHLNISVDAINNLKEVDDCCVESVAKLADYYNIPRLSVCLKDQVASQ